MMTLSICHHPWNRAGERPVQRMYRGQMIELLDIFARLQTACEVVLRALILDTEQRIEYRPPKGATQASGRRFARINHRGR